MKVSELGEFGLIDLLAKTVSGSPETRPASRRKLILGIGDDAAAWQDNDATRLATVDSLIENIHFSLETTPWQELGWKALAVNLSDIAAMGGVPTYALVSLALPGDTEVDDAAALYAGMNEMARSAGVAIVGGDTCRSPVVAITVTVLGESPDGRMLRRSGARPGDRIAVTGYPGGAAAGFEMLTKNLSLDSEAVSYLRNAFLQPMPRLDEGQLLARQGVNAAIDISDGLAADLRHVCRASGVGARVQTDTLPVHPTVRDNFGGRALELALAGGEDYELLFTAGEEAINRVKEAATCPIAVIGEITAENPGEVTLLDGRGNPVEISYSGWEHFRQG
jgi:thiamine-monophosphate kinase